MKSLSIVVPMYKEEDSVFPLVERVHECLSDYSGKWELICVDDGSPDNTVGRLKEAREQWGDHLRIVELQRNFGQTAAMQAGIDAARGEIIVTMDGDLQNDPADIQRMIVEMEERDLDMLQGWRKQREDESTRKFFSRQANRLIAKVTGVNLHDYGCSLKVYRASVIKQVRLFGEMHRFIPVWVASVTKPSRIGETVVDHHARQFGESKYGLSRTFRVILDLLVVFFFLKFKARPGHFFGYLGLAMGVAGSLIMTWLIGVKLFLGEDIGGRPLFLVGIFLLVVSLQFITTGVLAEMMSRIFFETSNTRGYTLRETLDHDEEGRWCDPQSGTKTTTHDADGS
ncbi:glycosyltransferase family 2 protein [Amphritea sp. 2_MG-2023]|uniref:glycosyltransferase family 2 protein n=1 Tax=Amphritea TaxID=515417 RepID=UPI001C07797F|nr:MULTISPECIES: glycosyltransferase family 2 protein [Amphritea]MBU2967577.1 glycosyltransferase family 2 protein [Amphritea atlantica]MDO6419065.1 glycosyltransferase family 2 protein [Amphritea sp. 2_MG-2023]